MKLPCTLALSLFKKSLTNSNLLGGWLLLAVVAGLAAQAQAQLAQRSDPSSALENLDVRTSRDAASVALLNRYAAGTTAPGVAAQARDRAAGVARMKAALKVDVTDSPAMSSVEVVSVQPGSGFLTAPSADRAGAMRNFMSSYADVFGLTNEQVAGLVVVADYQNPSGNLSWVEFEQRINGLPVFQGTIRGAFTARGELARTTGPLAAGLNGSALPAAPGLSAAEAVSRAATNVGWNVPIDSLTQKEVVDGRVTLASGAMAGDAKAWQVYFPLAPGVARLAWAAEIWGNPEAYLVLVDAQDGSVLFRKNLTDYESQRVNGAAVKGASMSVVSNGSAKDIRPAPPSAPTTTDFVAVRSFFRTATAGGGVEVDIPAVGQTVFFYGSYQVFGNGPSVSMTIRALLDGAQFCSGSFSVGNGANSTVNCSAGWVVTAGAHNVQWQLDYLSAVVEADETNNLVTKTFTSSTSTLDIMAQRAYMRTAANSGIELLNQPMIGETVFFHTNFQLTGTGGPVTVTYRAMLDGALFCSGSFAPSAPSGWTTWCNTGWVVTGGLHTLQWDIDFGGTVSESNEANNSVSISFTPVSTQATQTATYVVYDDDSPAPLSPTNVLPGPGTQAGFIARTSHTLIGNEAPNTFNNVGWMKDGANVTDGNNVEAGPDRDFVDGVDAPVSGVSRFFDFTYNPQADSPLSPAFQNGEVTDMFYWTNVYHDRLYLLGFTEAAKNFQNDNFGRGGAGGDRISAQSQDFSGLDNANFSTPADGSRPRMQMYLFPAPSPLRTSGIDHDVLLHELTHGTSNRLHNNGSGLVSTMSRGMGEGWSDFYARALLSTAAEDPNGIYNTGGWVTYLIGNNYADNYYYGIRRFPYAVKTNVGANGKPHNPLTFADIDAAQINTTDGAFPNNPFFGNTAFEVHNIGEVWCMALLEVRARFINRLGFATGNQRFLQFVTDGMKFDPVNPTLLQGRDSIIAAANAGGGTLSDLDDIWRGFAARGMGFTASVVNVNTGAVVEAFDLAGIAPATGSISSESIPNGWLDPGEVATVSLCVTNQGTTTSGSVTGTLFATGGVTLPSGSQLFGAIPPQGSVCKSFSFTVGATCGSLVTATLQAQETGGATRNLNFSFQVGGPLLILAENFDGVALPALPSGWSTSTLSGTANLFFTRTGATASPPNEAFAGNPATSSDNVLVSPTIAMPAGVSVLSFKHFYNTESTFDGGVLEIAIGGGAYQDIVTAGGSFASGAYTGGISSLGGQQAWTGNSVSYVTSNVNMPAGAANQNVQLRWRMVSDSIIGAVGWALDSIVLSRFQCAVPTAINRRGQLTSF